MKPVVQATDIHPHNAVTISPNGVILAVLTGFQDEHSAIKLRQDLQNAITVQRRNHHRVIVMLDVSRTTDHSQEAEAIYMSFIGSDVYDAMAVYGVGELKYAFALDLGKQLKVGDRFRPFANELEAARWLATYLIKAKEPPKKRRLFKKKG